MITLKSLDHLVLTVADIDRTCAFYHEVLGCEVVTFGAGRKALRFGEQKFNLHQAGHEFEPKAQTPRPGSADLCLITEDPIDRVETELRRAGIEIEEGPVARTGATGAIESVYIRDPDGNLLELSNYSNG
ncbi:VOC family protein [Roseovarius sp. CAU 1744]|uniref:VOC family protein n=1 Tax=Roseovarius sp. CAU 1744 TaxID=3140368 RepID=UPI00325AD114